MKNPAITLGALSLLGCSPTLVFKGAGVERPPKPPSCAFVLVTKPPAQPHEKLGTIEIRYLNASPLTDAEDLKRQIQPEVCKAGGDAAQGHTNSRGTYLKVTVFAWQAKAPAQSVQDADTSGGDAPAEDAKGL